MPIFTRSMEELNLNNNNNVADEKNPKIDQLKPLPSNVPSAPMGFAVTTQIPHDNSGAVNIRNFRSVQDFAHSFGVGSGGEFEKLIIMNVEKRADELDKITSKFNSLIDEFESKFPKPSLPNVIVQSVPKTKSSVQKHVGSSRDSLQDLLDHFQSCRIVDTTLNEGLDEFESKFPKPSLPNVTVQSVPKTKSSVQKHVGSSRDSLQDLLDQFQSCRIVDTTLNEGETVPALVTNCHKEAGSSKSANKPVKEKKRKVELIMEISQDGMNLTVTESYDYFKYNTNVKPPPVKKIKNHGSSTFVVEIENELIEKGNIATFNTNTSDVSRIMSTTTITVSKKPPIPPKAKQSDDDNGQELLSAGSNDNNVNETVDVFKDAQSDTFVGTTSERRTTFVVPAAPGNSTFVIPNGSGNSTFVIGKQSCSTRESDASNFAIPNQPQHKMNTTCRKTEIMEQDNGVSAYEITLLEDFTDDLCHREKKAPAYWATHREALDYQLFSQRLPANENIFPKTSKIQLYPGVIPPRRLP